MSRVAVSAFVFGVYMVVLEMARPTLILFGGIDLLGAIWTALALRTVAHRG